MAMPGARDEEVTSVHGHTGIRVHGYTTSGQLGVSPTGVDLHEPRAAGGRRHDAAGRRGAGAGGCGGAQAGHVVAEGGGDHGAVELQLPHLLPTGAYTRQLFGST